jgi:hypothetical protein
VVDGVGFKFVQDRHGNGSIGERSYSYDCPLCAIFAAEGYFVAGYKSTVLKEKVQFCDLTSYVTVGVRSSLVVR